MPSSMICEIILKQVKHSGSFVLTGFLNMEMTLHGLINSERIA